jgi:predicted double-glycine peptidase
MLVKSENTNALECITFDHIIRVPLCHQETPYSCGVACVQSILAGNGIIYTQDVLAERLGQKPIYGTDYKKIITFMDMLGFHASFHIGMNIDLLKELISNGITPILILQAWKDIEIDYAYDWKDAHYVIACGYDENRILFMDPWTLGNYTFIPINMLMKRWHDFDSSGNHSYQSGLIIHHEHLPFVYNPSIIKPMD